MSGQVPEPPNRGTQDDEATEPSEAQMVVDFLAAAAPAPLPLSRSLLLTRARLVNTAEQTARNAENTSRNKPGYCLQQCRIWAGISSKYPDATTAWLHTHDRHAGDRDIPRGAMAFWIGGSEGHGHVAAGLGGPVRSTDAGGTGIVATRTLDWFDENWPDLHYIGWAWDLNDVTIPHPEEPELNPDEWIKMKSLIADEVSAALVANNPDVVDAVWSKSITVTTPDGKETNKSTKQVIRETWQRIAKKL